MRTHATLARAKSPRRRAVAARNSDRLRQERGLRTEASILTATLDSLATRGIHDTSLELIAAQVGVAKSSILWHFGSKEGLLLRVAERAFSIVERSLAPEILALRTIEERGEAMWRIYTEIIDHAPEVRRVVLYLIFCAGDDRPEVRAGLQRLYRGTRTLLVAGLHDVVPDVRRRNQLATLAMAALDGIFLQWLLDPKTVDLAALQKELHRIAQCIGVVRPRRKKRRT